MSHTPPVWRKVAAYFLRAFSFSIFTTALLAGHALRGQTSPILLFAGETNRPTGSKVIDMSSGNSVLTGGIHCNSDIDVSGTGNFFRTGVVEHVTGVNPAPNFPGKVTLQNCPVVASSVTGWPVYYLTNDFAPGSQEAVAAQAAGKYFHVVGDTDLSAFISGGVLREGLYYVEGKVNLSKGGLTGHVTVVATKEITISGTGENWLPYTRCLLFFSARALAYYQPAVNVSGGSSRWEGVIFAPNAGVQISGSGNVVPRGALVARGIHLSGGSLNLTGMTFTDCPSAGASNQPPVVDAGGDQAITFPTNTVTLNGSVSDDGLPNGTWRAVWSTVSGPESVVFSQPSTTNTQPTTTVTFSAAGTYVLRLTADDGQLTSSDDVVVTVNRENHPPQALPQSVVIDEDASTNITLQGIDADGDPLSYTVTIVPTHGTLTLNSQLSTNNSVYTYAPETNYNGADQFTFKVSDGILESSNAIVAITIRPVNDAPVAVAISLTNTEDTSIAITLSGSDADGDALTYRVIAGPTNGTLTGPLTGSLTGTNGALTYLPNTNFFGEDHVTYVLNDGTTDSAPKPVTLTIVPIDDLPMVDAGPDQVIVLPTSAVSLAGTVIYDAYPGTVDTVQWAKVSGPGSVTFSDASNEVTSAAFSTNGVYVLRLTASDSVLTNSDDVIVAVDAPPVVTAGPAQTNTLPATIQLNGTVTDDGLPTNDVLSIEWSKVSGPGSVIFSNPNAAATTAAFSQSGVYVLQLTANDGAAAASSNVIVLVNQAPLVDAGSARVITNFQTVLNGTVFDDGLPNGSFVTAWSKVSGPGTVAFSQPTETNSQPATTATFSQTGVYVLQLIADDSLAVSSNQVTISVDAAPAVNAGNDQLITFPATATLTATASDDGIPEGSSLTYQWTQVNGPGTVAFGDTAALSTTASFSQPGSYVLQFSASDSLLNSADEVTVTVNQAPIVNAGPDAQAIPGVSVLLQGTVQDDGVPANGTLTAAWTVVSGPGHATLVTPDSPITQASFDAGGTYVLRLSASDSLATSSDDITIIVTRPNRAPVVSAGPKQLVTLPAGANLAGAVTDDGLPAGTPVTASWSKVSGPGTVSFSNPNSTNTSASFSDAGDYLLRLTANDTEFTTSADVQVKVRTPAMNEAPVVSAGPDKVIGLTNVATLNGSFTDDGLPEGVLVTVSWSKISGPGTVTFENGSVTNAHATFSSVGTYVLRLTANDSALSASDDLSVTVYPFNQPPVVDAGPDQTITIPDPSVLMSSGNTPTNAGTDLTMSLNETEHWNFAIGQPGLQGGGNQWVSRNGLDVSEGRVYAAGDFARADNLPTIFWDGNTNTSARSLAMWDGTNWHNFYDPRPIALPDPPGSTPGVHTGTQGTNIAFGVPECQGFEFCNETLNAIAVRGSNVFAAGSFKELESVSDGKKDCVDLWSGTGWEEWGFKFDGGQSPLVVKATRNKVYVAGGPFIFQTTNAIPGTFTNLAWHQGVVTWDGTNWGALDMSDLRGTNTLYVSGMAVASNGNVFVAGLFLMPTPTGIATNVAMWDGHQWRPLGTGVPELSQYGGVPPTALAFGENGDLYFGSFFTRAGGVTAHNIARWDGVRWWPLTYGTNEGVDGVVHAIAVHGRDVFVGGQFTHAGGVPAYRLGKWDGLFWRGMGTGPNDSFDGYVYALAEDDSGVYVGGDFGHIGTNVAHMITEWQFPKPPPRVAYLNGSVTDDGLPVGSALSSVWNKVSGPGDVTFADQNNPVTTATFSKAGTYVLRLSANDTEFTTLDEATIVVNGNKPPVVNAGTNFVVGIDEAPVLQGVVTDDGLPASDLLAQVWTMVNGPGTVTFDDPTSARTAVRFSQQGTYVLRLSANDSQFTSFSDVTITVLHANSAPQASIDSGSDTFAVMPDGVRLFGIVTDDGRPNGTLKYLWNQVSGPGLTVFGAQTITFSNATTIQFHNQAHFSAPGSYVLRLTATDSQLSGSADITVSVVSSMNDQPPVVFAGADQRIYLPNSAALNGIVLDDGPLANVQINWFASSGPGNVTFGDPASPSTTASFDTPGVYELVLSAREGWWYYVEDRITVTVLPRSDQNQPPQVYTGPPRSVPIGVPVELRGVVSDDGLPAGAALASTWSVQSGPGAAVFANSNSPVTTVVFSAVGQYFLELAASDSELSAVSDVTITAFDPAHGNQPPVVDAGPPQTNSYLDTVTLAGSVTDDGLPAPWALQFYWSQVSGPLPAQLSDAYSLNSTVSFSYPGTYVLRLTANDGQYVNSDDVVLTAAASSNQPPVVDAGPPLTVFVPTNSVVLKGSVSDDGLPAGGTLTVNWTVLYSLLPVSFSDPTDPHATLTFEGNPADIPWFGAAAILRLTASDGQATRSSDTRVVWIDPANHGAPPTANAGPDATITLPDSLPLQGSGGPTASYFQWTQVSGPAPVTFDYLYAPQTTAHFFAPGVYVLRLIVSDGILQGSDDVTVTVNPAANLPPVVSAGPPRTIPLANPVLLLKGTVADDGRPVGADLVSTWSLVDGPGAVVFSQPATTNAQPMTTATFSAAGTYFIQLTASDSNLSASDVTTITVVDLSIANQPPAVDAGTNFTVTVNEVAQLNGSVSDDGLPPSDTGYFYFYYNWTVVSGPSWVNFNDSSSAATTATFSVPGTYVLRLFATDGALDNSADVTVTVLSPPNEPPFVHAGFPQLVARQTGADLAGIVADDGQPTNGVLTATWSFVSGPGTVTFSQISNAFPNVTAHAAFSATGDYVLRLIASDSELSATNDVTITVTDILGGNHPPTVNAGPAASGTTLYPVTLRGAASDDGLPSGSTLATMWSQVSGPSDARFANASRTNTSASFFIAGTYVLRLAASDGQLSAADALTVTITDPTNQPPITVAGVNQTVTRPNAATLDGIVLDDGLPLGYPLTYQWSKVSGPGTVTFVTASNTTQNVTRWETVKFFDAFASATFSTNGQYVLRLSATDTQLTNFDEVTITVLAGVNSAPHVNAGPDQAIGLPNVAVLHTEVDDDGLPDGTVEISWSKVSGPGPVYINSINGVYQATFTTPGNYVLRLTANDGALSNSDDVAITVYDTAPPNAEINSPLDGAIITSPTNVIGTASSDILQSYVLEYRLKPADADPLAPPRGEGQGEGWTVLASNTVSVVSNALGVLDPTLSLNGIYELRLTATDLIGRSATTEPITVIFDRNLKIGQFTISFNDLSIPVPGLPLQITRTYDSRAAAAGIQGDFGIGWTMDLRNVRLQKNRSLARNWVQTTTGSPFDLSLAYHLNPINQRIVTITFPDGRVEKFRFDPQPVDQPLLPIGYPQWRFTPLDNTRGTLVPAGFDDPDGNFLFFSGAIPGTADLVDLNFFFDALTSNLNDEELQSALERYPTLFRYTSPEGYKYLIDENDGLQSVTDPNGNTLLISTNGLTWSNPNAGTNSLSIVFQRDAQGRITNIVDAAGHAMSYGYDAIGNLASYIDRVGQTNGFAYTNAAFPHHLTGIADPRGITPVRNEYDADGRLIGNLDAFGNAITYGHDLANNREYITNRLGFVTVSEYDDHGNVIRTIDPLGAESLSSYDENGNVLQTVDPLGRTNSFTYDALDNRLTATDPLGNTTSFIYSDLRRVTSVTDPRGNTITNVFDGQGNLLAMRDPLGNVTRFAYNNQGLPVAMTNALGQVMSFDYDQQGRLINEKDALGHGTDYQRDANGNLLRQTTTRTKSSAGVPPATETLTVQFFYDTQSRLTNSVFPDGSSAKTIYNAIGKPAVTIDQLGRPTTMEYDELGRVTRTIYPDGSSEASAFDAEGQRIASTNRLGQVTQYDYDADGRLFHAVMPDGTSTINYFDLAGQLFVATDARGANTFYGYDAAGRSVTVTNALGQVSRSAYDASGNVTNAVDALGRSTRFVYDSLNRRVQTIFADGTTQSTVYDVLGRRISETDQATNTTRFAYDTLGRLTAVTNALGYVTSYAYDELGQQISQTDANQHTTTFEYDSLGRRVKRTLPGNQIETYAYNIGGLLTNRTDFNGYTTTYQYDLMNRLLAKVPDPRRAEPNVTYAYNTLGLRTNMTDAAGSSAYTYDTRNRLLQKTRAWGVALSVSLNYAYDANGNLTNILSSDPDGVNVGYEYDALSRLSAVNDAKVGRTAYNYDDVGNLQSYSYPNGVSSVYQYDALNRLTNLASGKVLTPIAQYAYTVGASGNRLTASEQLIASPFNSHPSTINRVYTYDSIYRLTGETINGTPSGGLLGYNYDPVGNRLTRNSTLADLLPQTFSFDANDRLNTDSYDNNGNTLIGAGFGQLQPDQYDFENRLISRQTATNTITIQYDGDGNRVRKTVTTATNTTTTYFVVDELNPSGYAQVLEEHVSLNSQPSTLNHVYSYGHTLISQDRLEGATWRTSFYGYDGHNSVRYLTDLNGFVTDTYDYDAFGNLIARTGNTPNNYLFTGEQFDPDLQLYYLRARYHNPDTGRFWTMDEFDGFSSDPASLHKYAYCGDNPLNSFDPSGNFTITETIHVQAIGFKARLAIATLLGTISGAVSALDTALGKNYDVSKGELKKAFWTGFRFGFVLGFAGTYFPNAVAVVGAAIGGWGVGSAIDAAIHEGGTGNWAQVLFRAGTLSLGLIGAKSVTTRQLTTAYEEASPSSDFVALRTGTTEKMAEHLLPNGPDADFVAPGDPSPTGGISFEPPNSGSPITAEDYAVNRAATHPEEGDPVVVTIIVPRWLVKLAYDYSADGEIRFAPGRGLEQLQKLWPYVRVKNARKVNVQSQPKN